MLRSYVCSFVQDYADHPELIEHIKKVLRADRRVKLGELQNLFATQDPESKLRPLIDQILLDDSDLRGDFCSPQQRFSFVEQSMSQFLATGCLEQSAEHRF